MKLQPSDDILNQVTALYSQENKSVPAMEQCLFPYTQTGSTDCGLYAIAYAVDLAAGNNHFDIIYDQSAMRSHLSQCILENRISFFQRHRLCPDKNYYINCKKHTDSTK